MFHCVSANTLVNKTLLVLEHTPRVWMPVNLMEAWANSPEIPLLQSLNNHLAHRTEIMLGLIIAGIISLVLLAQVLPCPLHVLAHSIQTCHL